MIPRFECINQTPKEFYHYTLKSNIESITSGTRLKMGEDGYVWGCTSFEDIVRQFNATVLNPNYARHDGKGGIETIQNTNKEDYVILKITPKFNIPQSWYVYIPLLPTTLTAKQTQDPIYNPYALSVAYQGNLRIGTIDIIEIPE